MLKCPFCHYDNEDGSLFCEQCKSDLSAAGSMPAIPVAHAEPIPMDVPEAMPLEAMPLEAEAIPIEAEPVPAMPVEESHDPFNFAPAHLVEATPVAEAHPAPAAEPIHHAEPIPELPHPVEPPPAPVHHAAPPPPPPAPPAPAPAAPVAAAPPPPSAPAPAPAAPAPAPAAPAEPAAGARLPAGAQPRLTVLRGQRRNVEYPIYEGLNFIGRADEKPVDIDLEDQEPPDRVWCSRQHACISLDGDQLGIEDLNSANGTYVNRNRIYPGQKRPLVPNDIIQIGNVQLKVVV